MAHGVLRGRLLVALAMAISIATPAASMAASTAVQTEPVRAALARPVTIAPGLQWLQGEFTSGRQPDGNTLIWDSGKGLVVMDTGRHPGHTQAIVAEARRREEKIVALIISHWHLDHVGGNVLLRRQFPDAPVYAGNGGL